VTLGQTGCLWLDKAVHRQPAAAVQAIDSTGAGDSFCGALAAALGRDVDLGTAIGRAQAAAAISVKRRGAFASLPTAEELRASPGCSG
jgi:ribokinase